MTQEEYAKKFVEDQPIGWQFIDNRLKKIYPDQDSQHFAPRIPYALGGENPLDGVSVYKSNKQEPHFHFVTYGFSELYYNDTSVGNEFSNYGFELTFRLRKNVLDNNMMWVCNLLQNMAKYVFQTGKWFEENQVFPTNGPICLDHDTELVALAIVIDPELGKIQTPHGKVEFLQLVGLTHAEYEGFKAYPYLYTVEEILQKLKIGNDLLITDLDRKT